MNDKSLMKTIGLIGAGHIGSQVARLAVRNNYNVVISNSRGAGTLSALVAELGPRARSATSAEAAKAGDIVVVTVPLKNYRAVPVEPLAEKIVIDTNNYYPERDGHIAELDNESTTTSELLQAHLPTSKVVKAFNHIYAAALTTDGQPSGTRKTRPGTARGARRRSCAETSRRRCGTPTTSHFRMQSWANLHVNRRTPRKMSPQRRRDGNHCSFEEAFEMQLAAVCAPSSAVSPPTYGRTK